MKRREESRRELERLRTWMDGKGARRVGREGGRGET